MPKSRPVAVPERPISGPGGAGCFRWHPEARLYGPDGDEVGRDRAFAPLPDAAMGGGALAAALAGQGRAFRIGGQGGLEAGPGAFETLTGGSLGTPRRVIRTQQSWLESFAVNARLFGIGPGARVAVPGGLVHSLALYGALEGLALGAFVHLLDGLRPDRQAAFIGRSGVDVLYATPAQLRPLTEAGQPLPQLRHVIVGGAKLDLSLRDAVGRIAARARVHEFYGAAETSFVTLSGRDSDPQTVGQVYPGVALRVGPDGLVWVKSPYLFQRYAGSDRGSARWDDDWLTVGEMGRMTPGGLVLLGRAGRMVTVADRNVFPEQIEQFLLSLPGVSRAAVLSVPDDRRGHVLVAHLLGDPGAEAVILGRLRAELGPLVAPRRIYWRGDWPVLASGKTDLAALMAETGRWR